MDIEADDIPDVAATTHQVWKQGAMSLSDRELREAIRGLETLMRQHLATQLQCVAEAEHRGLPVQDGARNAKAWLQQMVRISGAEAQARVNVAREVEHRHALAGEPLPPQCPATAHALGEGRIGLEHAHAIVRGMRQTAPLVSSQQAEQTETLLADQASVLDPRGVRVLAERARYHADQDGALREEEHQFQARELHYAVAPDGMTMLRGRVDRETGAKLRAVLEPLAAPKPQFDGGQDLRSAGERNADALAEVLDLALSTDRLPRAGGQRPHLTVTVDYASLRQQLPGDRPAPATLETTGQSVTTAQVRRWACDAEILPMVLGSESQPLDVGRAQRSAPVQVRAALLARDGHCAFPACDHPPGTSEAHHLREWADGGTTSLDNMVMLCARHHRIVHTQGWEISLATGRPEFLPLSSVDPYRKPISAGKPPPHPGNLGLFTAA